MSFVVSARYECRPQDRDEVEACLLAMRTHTLQEPGNLDYVVHRSVEEDNVFLLHETYVDEAAFTAHAAADYFAELIVGTVKPLLVGREVGRYTSL